VGEKLRAMMPWIKANKLVDKDLGKLGWIPAFVYIAGAALRLARFNTNIGVVDKRFFQGLPSPAAAALVMGLIWVMDDAGFKARRRWTGCRGRPSASRCTRADDGDQRCPSTASRSWVPSRPCPSSVIVAIALGIALISQHPPLVLFALFCGYGCQATWSTAGAALKGKPVSVIATSTDEPDEKGLHAVSVFELLATQPSRKAHHDRQTHHLRHHLARRRTVARRFDDARREAAHRAPAGALRWT
jgi:hypothetical protein